MVGPVVPVNLACPAVVAVPIYKVSAATVPEKVTILGAVFASLSLTVIELLDPVSVIVPAIVIAEVLITCKVEEPLKAIVDAMVTSSLTVAVLFPAIVRLFAVTAALKVALLFKVMSAKEVVPTIPEKVALPDPRVTVKLRLVSAESESTVELKVMLLSVVVNVLVPPDKVTAPVYVCVEEVVTFAPKLEVEDTSNDVALVIAAFKSKVPVISITPKVLLPPIIPSNCNSEAVTVRLLVSSVSELTVVSKVIWALVVVRVLLPVTVTAPS